MAGPVRGCVLLLAMVVLVTGCSATEDAAPAPSGSAADFEGTPAEYTTMLRACLEEQGVETYDMVGSEDPTGFMGSNDVPLEQREAAYATCRAEIGEPRMEGLSSEELQRRYDARLEQWSCLTDRGLVGGEAPSFEVFVDRYERSGQTQLWEPTEGAATVDADGRPISPSDVCMRSADVW